MAVRSQSPHTGSFDVVTCMRRYVDRIVSEKGLKILLVDDETSGMLSMVCSFSEILQRDLYLLERLDNTGRARQGHLKAIVFVRPTQQNIDLLRQELQKPLYGEYLLFFPNVVETRHLELLAARDSTEAVKQVQELYCDFYAQHPHLFTLEIEKPLLDEASWMLDDIGRVTDGIIAALLALRKKPVLRFQHNSTIARRLAGHVAERMQEQQELFATERRDDSVLLFVDRKDDAVTPLLTQWTYEAMVHNEFGVRKHCCTVPGTADQSEEAMNLTPMYDPFYRDNLYKDWGDLTGSVQELKTRYSEKSEGTRAAQSKGAAIQTDDIKKIMAQIPELRKEGILITKHLTLATRLQKTISEGKLLDVSELEQEVACDNSFKEHTEKMRAMLARSELAAGNLLRLVMIYALRYERHRNGREAIAEFQKALRARDELPASALELVDRLLAYAGASERASDLFEDGGGIQSADQRRGLLHKAKQAGAAVRRAMGPTKGAECVYTQHEPQLKRTVEALFEGKLPAEQFAFHGAVRGQGAATPKTREVIVFVCGGATYEESRALVEMLAEREDTQKRELRWPGHKILLGTTSMLRTETFLRHLAAQ